MIVVLVMLVSLWGGASPRPGELALNAMSRGEGVAGGEGPELGEGRVVAHLLPTGVALPYPTARLFRGFEYCRGRGRHHHEAIDLGGVGPEAGLGTAIRSLGPARVTRIGKAEEDPKLFGTPDLRKGKARRGARMLTRTAEIEGYGEVCFFSRRRGSWRSGNLVEVVGTAGPLAGHRVRYLHLGAVRPDLEVGDELAAGEELGLLGGTGVQKSSPHVHIDIVDPEGVAVDVAPLLGLGATAKCGPVAERARAVAAAHDPADPRWRPTSWPPPVGARGMRARTVAVGGPTIGSGAPAGARATVLRASALGHAGVGSAP